MPPCPGAAAMASPAKASADRGHAAAIEAAQLRAADAEAAAAVPATLADVAAAVGVDVPALVAYSAADFEELLKEERRVALKQLHADAQPAAPHVTPHNADGLIGASPAVAQSTAASPGVPVGLAQLGCTVAGESVIKC